MGKFHYRFSYRAKIMGYSKTRRPMFWQNRGVYRMCLQRAELTKSKFELKNYLRERN